MKLLKIYKIHLEKNDGRHKSLNKGDSNQKLLFDFKNVEKVLNVNVLFKKFEEILTDCSTLCPTQINQY